MALIHSPKGSSCWQMMLLRPPDFQGVAMSKKTRSLFMSFQLSLGSSFQKIISSNSIPSSLISKNMAYLAHSQRMKSRVIYRNTSFISGEYLWQTATRTAPSRNYLWQTLEDPFKANNTSSQSGSPDGPFHLDESSKGVSITCDRISIDDDVELFSTSALTIRPRLDESIISK